MNPAEAFDAMTTFGGQVVYLPDIKLCGVQVVHAGRTIIVCKAPGHPYEPFWVFLDPPTNHPHYYWHGGNEPAARLCWCKPSEWDPTFSPVVAIGCAIRFINEELGGQP